MIDKTNLQKSINSLTNEISILNGKLSRLKVANKIAKSYCEQLIDYKNKLDSSNRSITTFGISSDWEGQTLHDFMDKYDSALVDLKAIVEKSKEVISDIENEINRLQSVVKSKRGALRLFEFQLENVLN